MITKSVQHKCFSPHLQQVEVSVELRALGVFQTFKLSGDEQEDILDARQKNTITSDCVDYFSKTQVFLKSRLLICSYADLTRMSNDNNYGGDLKWKPILLKF